MPGSGRKQKNVEHESLKENLLFLGLADYAKLGKAYALHYQLPYYQVFHQGMNSKAQGQFSTKSVQYLLCLPIESDQKEHFTIVSCQPGKRCPDKPAKPEKQFSRGLPSHGRDHPQP